MCWEDYAVVARALEVKPTDSVLSIVSGGENLFALALEDPKKIVGVDNNPAQIYLAKLKAAAITTFSYETFLSFIGILPCENRLKLYESCSARLTPEENLFWKEHKEHVKKGILLSGKFESYLSYFRRFILPFVLRKHDIGEYLKLDSLEDQLMLYRRKWDNRRWRLLFRIFFSRPVMSLLGRDPRAFRFAGKNISEEYLKRAERGITCIPVRNNPFIQTILLGAPLMPIRGHPYLDRDNFELLKKRIHLIEYQTGEVRSAGNEFSKVFFSDIFESMSQQEYEAIISSFTAQRICYFNNLVDRSNHAVKRFSRMRNLENSLKQEDRIFFYSGLVIESAKEM
jgi:S-adenosylmethionine-diacylglycerol 3-amino-3-carboxypropyl transferase